MTEKQVALDSIEKAHVLDLDHLKRAKITVEQESIALKAQVQVNLREKEERKIAHDSRVQVRIS